MLVRSRAAMPSEPVPASFRKRADRFFERGIAEAQATTFAAGLATQASRPVVANLLDVLQRAYEASSTTSRIQQLPVIFCLDRRPWWGGRANAHGL